jgi:S-adenosylmethionine:tRNA ribosyltransferase-isomerase
VGPGTFRPLRSATIEAHTMNAERYWIAPTTAAALEAAKMAGKRLIAVGTTTTRTLESLVVDSDGDITPGSGETTLFIYPGFNFRIVSGLVTNFHLPKSSLLMLVAAFAGRERLLAAYREAVARGYRFYSYGDAMLVI